MTTTHLSTTSPAWAPMWDALADATGSRADYCTETGECWQYVGTYDGAHQFRHRNRPESCPPIKGYAGKHCDRVYLHIDAETLRVTRVHVKRYLDDKPSDYDRVRAIEAARKQFNDARMNCPRCGGNHPLRDCPRPDQEQFEANCGGAFDGFSVVSDADPGL